MTMERPKTPHLDAVERELSERQRWESEEEQRLADAIAKRKADDATRAERARINRERRPRCEQAAHDAEQAAVALADALRRYQDSIPLPLQHRDVSGRLRIFLGNHLHQFSEQGMIESNLKMTNVLLSELHKEAR